MRFIEITNRNGHERSLLRLELIERIDEERPGVTIYLTTRTKSGEQQYIDVEESYDELRELLSDCISRLKEKEDEE